MTASDIWSGAVVRGGVRPSLTAAWVRSVLGWVESGPTTRMDYCVSGPGLHPSAVSTIAGAVRRGP